MDLHNQINTWLLEAADYREGLSLLEASGVTGIVYRTLALGEDPYNRERLTQELTKQLSNPKNVLPIGGPLRPGPIDNSAKSAVLPKPLLISVDCGVEPATVIVRQDIRSAESISGADALKERAQDLMNERSELKAQLRAFADDESKQEARRDWAYRILAITDELDDLYSRLQFLDQYGYLPPTEEPKPEVDDTALLMNVRTYVSRYRAKLKRGNLSAEQLDNFTKLLQQYESEKARLELKLKAHEI